jgi:hypothetical protein
VTEIVPARVEERLLKLRLGAVAQRAFRIAEQLSEGYVEEAG